MSDYDGGFIQEFTDNLKDAYDLLQEATRGGDESEISAAWDLYESAAAELETARDLAAAEWGWDDESDEIRRSEEDVWADEDKKSIDYDPLVSWDPSTIPGAELRGEPFAFVEDAIAYVADIAGTAQSYFHVYENEAGSFEVWFAEISKPTA